MRQLRRERSNRKTYLLEALELRVLLSASFDITDLTEMRNDPSFSQITGAGIGIAVLDTGVDAKNPELAPNVVAFYNAVEDPVVGSSTSVVNAVDNDGHGTHVSGIAASSNPAIGVAYDAKLVDIKVLADADEAQLGGDPILRGLQWVAGNYQKYNIKVVNMSLGESGVNEDAPTASDMQDPEAQEIQVLQRLGITVVSASGNSYAQYVTPGESFPAIVSTIGVANTWDNSGMASDFGSPYGEDGDEYFAIANSAAPDTFNPTSQRSTDNNQLAAPGSDIYSDWNGTVDSSNGSDLLHNTLSGTSMASPFISGTVALMQDAAKYFGGQYLPPSQILHILQTTADTIVDSVNNNDQRYDSYTGDVSPLPETGDTFKRVNVLKAIEMVESIVTGGAVTTGPAPGPDTNNTAATAIQVSNINGTTVDTFDGNVGDDGLVEVGANDVDLYELDVVSPGNMTCQLTQSPGGTAFAAALRLFNSSGTVVASIDGTAGSYPTLSTMAPLSVGTYYLGISSVGNESYTINGTGAANGSTEGDYTVQITLSNPDPVGTIQGAIPVDLTEPTETLQNPNTGAYYSDVLETADLGSDPPPNGGSTPVQDNSDVQIYSMTAPDSGMLNLEADEDPSSGDQTFLEVFDSNQNSIGTSDSTTSPTPGVNDLSVQVTSGQTYYVAITVPQNSNFNPSDPYVGRVANVTLVDQPYELHLYFNNGDVDGSANSANLANIGTTVNGNIGEDNGKIVGANGSKDVDWYQYTAGDNGIFEVTAQGTGNGFTPLITLWTLTADQSDIIEVANSATSSVPGQLDYQVTNGETFFVAATSPGNGNFNWYTLASGSGGTDVGTNGSSYQLTTELAPTTALSTLSDNSVQNGAPQTISLGQTINGNIGSDGALVVGPSDVDIYKFVAPATQTVVAMTNTNQEGSAATFLRFFDGNGNQLAADANINSTTTDSEVMVSVRQGQTYYIGIDGAGADDMNYSPLTGANAGNGSTGNYALTVAAAPPGLSVNAPNPVAAFSGGTLLFTVTLDAPLTTTVTVDYATADGTAIAGTDYTAESGTLTFAPGATTQTVAVPVLPNMTLSQNDLTMTLTLSNVQGAQISSGTATGMIEDIAGTNLTFSNKKPASYINSLGKHVQLALTGAGTGTAVFVNDGLDPALITFSNTTGASAFSVKGGATLLTDITVNGSIGAIDAPTVTLNGGMNITGSLEKLVLNNVNGGSTGGSIITGAAGAPMLVTLGFVSNESFSTPSSIAQLKVGDWINSSAGMITISAASIALLSSKGNFAPSVTAQAIGTATISKSLTGGTWTIAGPAKSVAVSGAVAAAWNATFTGGIASAKFGSDSGSLTAASITSLRVTTGLSDATFDLTSAGTDLGTFMVSKGVLDTDITAAGNVGKVSVGSFIDSNLLAGISATVTGLPNQAADFITGDSIASFTVTASSAPAFSDSNIAAVNIGKIMVAKVNPNNNGTPFGFSAESIQAVSNKGVLTWKSSDPVSLLVPDGDFDVLLVS